VEAHALLAGGLAGRLTADAAQRAATERVVSSLSSFERGALAGTVAGEGADVLRAAAAHRLRLALATATSPQPPATADQRAADALLASVDGVIAQLKALVPSSPPEVALELEAIRLALVDAGVEVATALSRLASTEAEPRPPAAEAKPTTRVLSNESVAAPPRARKRLLAALVTVAIAVGGYHSVRIAKAPSPRPPAALPGAPAHTYTVRRGASHLLMTLAGKSVDPAELERFTAQQQLAGRDVRPLAPGVWIVEPVPTGGGGTSP
jgi:hypothetical protein